MKKTAQNDTEKKTAGDDDTSEISSEGMSAGASAGKADESAGASANNPDAKAALPAEPDLFGRVEELEKENGALKDQYLRKAAEFDNYRKRMLKEKQDAIDFANTNLLVDLVQILDDFDRAIQAGGVIENGSPVSAFSDGIAMIRTQLGSMLENKYGLAYFPSKGTAFDPNIHQAIGKVESPDVKEPTVAEEFVKGYKLKDRVIREAKVMVSMPVESEKQ
jgi:molecular chaperone GrpE